MSAAQTTKDRIVVSTTSLFSRQGYNGTGIKQIAAEAGAPFGSIYHFFPGGKEELGAAVIDSSGDMYLMLIDLFYGDADDLVAATRAFFDAGAVALKEMDYADPCAIATVAMEMSSISEPIRQACAGAFGKWIDRAAEYLERGGIDADHTHGVATALVAALEGGFMIGRALRSPDPVVQAGDQAVAAVSAALAASR